MTNVIFLDIDGVLNCELHYQSKHFADYKEGKKTLKKQVKKGELDRLDYYNAQICPQRIKWLNKLCEETDSVIVVSSTWRSGKTVAELQEIFDSCGATFTVLDKTGHCSSGVRGVEIKQWLDENCTKHFGVHGFDFYRYAIIDDDSDMLLNQGAHFFKTDTYSGLTPNTCHRIKRFFTHVTF